MVLNGKAIAKRMEKMVKTISALTGGYTTISTIATGWSSGSIDSNFELWLGEPIDLLMDFEDLAEMQEFIDHLF